MDDSQTRKSRLELGEERRRVTYAFGIAVVGTGTFNFWQNAAKRGSFL